MSDEQLAIAALNIQKCVNRLPSRISKLMVSKYAEKRIMPAGSPRPGPWDNSITPYLNEPMDNMSPSSPVQREIILKAAQGGWTAMAENVVCYFMDEAPADILFMSAGDDVLERWASRRLEPAIDSFGFRDKLIIAQEGGKKSKKSGDTTFNKSYYGGRLDMASGRSASSMRATDKRILIRDEIDGVPSKLTTGEGYWLDVSWARTKAWSMRRKVMDFGTPTTYEKSEIWKAYLLGDQRKFLVPCPLCGAFQPLVFGDDKTQHGVKAVRKAGKLVDAVYMCDHCHDGFSNTQKKKVLIDGYWDATTKASEPNWVSRHWNSCYSPFMTFRELWSEYEQAQEKPDGMRSFVNLNEGLPYKETGTRLSKSKLISLRSTYPSESIPEGVLFTTGGIDVQAGSESDPTNPPRIEVEICGHGRDYRTWSSQYIRIEGSVDNAFSGAFQELYNLIQDGKLTYKDRLDRKFTPVRIFMDSGHKTHVVYTFVERIKGMFAVKGMGATYKPDETSDKRRQDSDRRYKISKNVNDTTLYIIATNEYKNIMRSALRVQKSERGETQPKMLCEFPSDYDEGYFAMLNAETKLADGSFESYGRRNEATDCRVYNMCAAEAYLNDAVKSVREGYKKRGFSERESKSITKEHILLKLEKKLLL